MDRHGFVCRGGVEAHGLAAAEHGAHDHVAGAAGADPVADDGRPLPALRRRPDVAVAGAERRGGLRHRRLLPDAGLHIHRLALRAALHDPLGPYGGTDRTPPAGRADASAGHRGHGGDAEWHSHVDTLQEGQQRPPQPAAQGHLLRRHGRHLPRVRAGAQQGGPRPLFCRRSLGRDERGATWPCPSRPR